MTRLIPIPNIIGTELQQVSQSLSTDVRISNLVDINYTLDGLISLPNVGGSGVVIANGFVLSALHVFELSPFGADFFGFFGANRDDSTFLQFPIQPPLFNPDGLGTDGFVVAAPGVTASSPPPSFIIYSDPNDAAGATISTFGYPGVRIFRFACKGITLKRFYSWLSHRRRRRYYKHKIA